MSMSWVQLNLFVFLAVISVVFLFLIVVFRFKFAPIYVFEEALKYRIKTLKH